MLVFCLSIVFNIKVGGALGLSMVLCSFSGKKQSSLLKRNTFFVRLVINTFKKLNRLCSVYSCVRVCVCKASDMAWFLF